MKVMKLLPLFIFIAVSFHPFIRSVGEDMAVDKAFTNVLLGTLGMATAPIWGSYLGIRTAIDQKGIVIDNISKNKAAAARIYFVKKSPEFKALSVKEMFQHEGYGEDNIEDKIREEKASLKERLNNGEINSIAYAKGIKQLHDIKTDINKIIESNDIVEIQPDASVKISRPKRKLGWDRVLVSVNASDKNILEDSLDKDKFDELKKKGNVQPIGALRGIMGSLEGNIFEVKPQ